MEKRQEIYGEIARHLNVMIESVEDLTACLGLEVERVDDGLTDLDVSSFQKMIERVVEAYLIFKATATTMRGVETTSFGGPGAMCWIDGQFRTAAQARRSWTV